MGGVSQHTHKQNESEHKSITIKNRTNWLLLMWGSQTSDSDWWVQVGSERVCVDVIGQGKDLNHEWRSSYLTGHHCSGEQLVQLNQLVGCGVELQGNAVQCVPWFHLEYKGKDIEITSVL